MARRRKTRMCLPSGYMYKFEGTRQWRRASDERWEVVVHKTVCGTMLGHRRVDGADVTVVKVGSRGIFASMHARRR